MAKGARSVMLALFSLVLLASFLVTGCNRYANEEQLTTLEETQGATVAAEEDVAKLEAEKADLQAKLEQKKQELEKVKANKAKIEEAAE
jgi:uncharacterized protein YlxW (UPF0749 family)